MKRLEWESKLDQKRLDQLNFDALYGTGEAYREATRFLRNAPKIDTPSRFYWRAFGELKSERPLGLESQGQIPTRALFAYADEYGLRGREREVLFQVIRTLDTRDLNLSVAKAKKEAEKNKTVHGGRAGKVEEVW